METLHLLLLCGLWQQLWCPPSVTDTLESGIYFPPRHSASPAWLSSLEAKLAWSGALLLGGIVRRGIHPPSQGCTELEWHSEKGHVFVMSCGSPELRPARVAIDPGPRARWLLCWNTQEQPPAQGAAGSRPLPHAV